MARGIGRSGSSRPVFGELQHNADPPQSSLAAQLVKHFTEGQRDPKSQDQGSFGQLLQELLDSENDHQSQDSHKNSSEVNFKLILVVVKAGLEIRADRDPLAEQLKQAIDSLAAVNVTIQRSPEVLCTIASTQDDKLGHDGPLFVWLIPRLLALIDHRRNGKLNAEVMKVLKTICRPARGSHPNGIKLNFVYQYLQGLLHGKHPLDTGPYHG